MLFPPPGTKVSAGDLPETIPAFRACDSRHGPINEKSCLVHPGVRQVLQTPASLSCVKEEKKVQGSPSPFHHLVVAIFFRHRSCSPTPCPTLLEAPTIVYKHLLLHTRSHYTTLPASSPPCPYRAAHTVGARKSPARPTPEPRFRDKTQYPSFQPDRPRHCHPPTASANKAYHPWPEWSSR